MRHEELTAIPRQMTDHDIRTTIDDGGGAHADVEMSTSGAPCDREPIGLQGRTNASFAEIVAAVRAAVRRRAVRRARS
jgi:hypothetical protein